jgi:hypothetical protein
MREVAADGDQNRPKALDVPVILTTVDDEALGETSSIRSAHDVLRSFAGSG